MEARTRNALAATSALALFLGALGVWSLIRDPGSAPVMVGGDPMLDACAAIGMALSAGVEVRAGPGDEYPVIDELIAGLPLSVCSAGDDGVWRAIVYAPPEQPALDCGVATPIAAATRYGGPCRSGWVRVDTIQTVAG